MANLRRGDNYSNITTATTTVVKSGSGTLRRIMVSKAVPNGVITVYDNTSATGTKIATSTMPATVFQDHYLLEYDVAFSVGLTVVTSGTPDITVVWN